MDGLQLGFSSGVGIEAGQPVPTAALPALQALQSLQTLAPGPQQPASLPQPPWLQQLPLPTAGAVRQQPQPAAALEHLALQLPAIGQLAPGPAAGLGAALGLGPPCPALLPRPSSFNAPLLAPAGGEFSALDLLLETMLPKPGGTGLPVAPAQPPTAGASPLSLLGAAQHSAPAAVAAARAVALLPQVEALLPQQQASLQSQLAAALAPPAQQQPQQEQEQPMQQQPVQQLPAAAAPGSPQAAGGADAAALAGAEGLMSLVTASSTEEELGGDAPPLRQQQQQWELGPMSPQPRRRSQRQRRAPAWRSESASDLEVHWVLSAEGSRRAAAWEDGDAAGWRGARRRPGSGPGAAAKDGLPSQGGGDPQGGSAR